MLNAIVAHSKRRVQTFGKIRRKKKRSASLTIGTIKKYVIVKTYSQNVKRVISSNGIAQTSFAIPLGTTPRSMMTTVATPRIEATITM